VASYLVGNVKQEAVLQRAFGPALSGGLCFLVHAEVEAAAAEVEPVVRVAVFVGHHALVQLERLGVVPQVEVAVAQPVLRLRNWLARTLAELGEGKCKREGGTAE